MKKATETLSSYVRKIHNAAVVARFESIRASSGDAAAIDYAVRMLGPDHAKHERKMKKLAGKYVEQDTCPSCGHDADMCECCEHDKAPGCCGRCR